MRGHKWFRELVLTVTLFTPTLARTRATDSNKAAVTQSEDACSRIPTIVDGDSSQIEIDQYFNISEAEWTDKDLSQLSSDYSSCYESSTLDFGQKSVIRSEFPAIVQNIIASADKYRQAAKVVQIEKSSFSPECQAVISELFGGRVFAPENSVPFQSISDLHKDGRHDEACAIDRSWSTKLLLKRTIDMQCFDYAKSINAPTFKPFYFSTLAGANEKLKSVVDSEISFYECPR